MGVNLKVATTCLNWSQPPLPHSPSSPLPQTLASAVSSSPSPSKRRSCSSSTENAVLVCRYMHGLDRSALFGTSESTKLSRSRSYEKPKSRAKPIRRACSASLEAFSDEEFSRKIQELAIRFQLSDDGESSENSSAEAEPEMFMDSRGGGESRGNTDSFNNFVDNHMTFPRASMMKPLEPPDWTDEIIPASIERKANSVELPLSLRMIKRKKQWQEGFIEAGGSAYCSMKKAFSSMVFIIRELQSYTLQMREILFYEDLQGILVRVQKEMNASFVWLFQQVFSHTPTLMVYVMILLANYSVHSMASNPAIAATAPVQSYVFMTESVSPVENENQEQKFDSSAIKTFSVSSSSSGKTTSIGGNNGGGGKFRVVGSGMEGEGRFDGSLLSDYHRTVLPDEVSSIGNPTRTSEDESTVTREEEVAVWNSMVEEATKMQAAFKDEALDHETKQRFVSPVTAKVEADDYADYFRTELLYQTGLVQEPTNPLLLANYAQFLYLVAQDYERAEDYFKRAVKVEPKDAEAFSKYASFLWQARNDLWAAEETYLEALSIDPSNSYYAANYAHFLWSTGGDDTCFPLSSPDCDTNEEI